jgi:predicted transcriptional regulator
MSPVTSITLDEKSRRKLSELAQELGVSRNEIIRRLINKAAVRHVLVTDVSLDRAEEKSPPRFPEGFAFWI